MTEVMGRTKDQYVEVARKTAITRRGLSAPIKALLADELLVGDVLDYGCGKGQDADKLGFDKYDPNYHNVTIEKLYDTIVCNYVLNVLPKEYESEVILDIKSKLKDTGTAYITVRRDVQSAGFTDKGTYQRRVTLDYPSVLKTRGYETYVIYGGIN